jgi:S-DNA-T family DNA segregation ATPase FtsK/SpoIIIE
MPRNASRSTTPAFAGDAAVTASVGRTLLWVGLLGGWLFLLASLVSYNRGDYPSDTVWPPNEGGAAANWCGPAGAEVAYYSLRLLGAGAWALLLAGLLALCLMAVGRRVAHFGVRLIGVFMISAAVSALAALWGRGGDPIPYPAGGMIGAAAVAELAARFSTLGTLVWVLFVALVGSVVAFDQWTLIAPAWLFRRAMPVAARAGGVAGGAAVKATGGLVGALAGMLRGRKPVAVRVDDLDDVDETPVARTRVRGKGAAATAIGKIAETAGGIGATESFDPDLEEDETGRESQGTENRSTVVLDEDEEAELEAAEAAEAKRASNVGRGRVQPAKVEEDEGAEVEDRDEEDGEGARGAGKREVDMEALRAKISKLPIRFAATDRKVATEDDLRDLQGVTELEGYRFPGLDLLEEPEANFSARLEGIVREQAEALEAALRQYKIEGEVVGIESGPVITLYDVRLAPGTKVAQLTAVSSDVARALKAVNIRIVANMLGRDTVGVEVPNPTKEKVRLKELMSNSDASAKMKLPMFLGKDASGQALIADLTTMPHMLIAGTTGSGKSVAMNTIIMGFLYTKKPNELKLVLVDPKMVEMSQFKDIPHLMCPVVTDMGKATAILEWACGKMDERYEVLAEAGCRDIASYNELSWEELKERFGPQTPEEEARIPRKLPYMVFIIDELADLMMTQKEVEGSIIRIAQKARAVGIHLILATQRPQANVVTGLIKSNMPCRISFKVASGMDSRIVLDQKGGELLLGQGDMLYLSPRTSKLMRAQGTLVDDLEIRKVVRFMKDVATPTFERQLMVLRAGGDDEERIMESENHSSASLAAAQEDPMFDRAVEIVLETKRGSVSLLQRRLAIGYTRASRLIDLMGIAGIISDHKGSVARDVMITPEDWEAMKKLHAEELAKMGKKQGELFEGGAAGSPTAAGGSVEEVVPTVHDAGPEGGDWANEDNEEEGGRLPAAPPF